MDLGSCHPVDILLCSKVGGGNISVVVTRLNMYLGVLYTFWYEGRVGGLSHICSLLDVRWVEF